MNDGLLYHYTSPEGLYGIIDSNHIRLGHIKYLNDSEELIHGLDLFKENFASEFIAQLDKRYHPMSSNPSLLKDTAITAIGAYIDALKNTAPFYSASFCKNGDKLRQWMGYCPNGGYAIGVRRNYIEQEWKNERVFVDDVKYDDVSSFRESYIAFLADLCSNFSIAIGDAAGDELAESKIKNEFVKNVENRAVDIAVNSLFVKNSNFSDEEEVRVVKDCSGMEVFRQNNMTDLKFYGKGNLLIPYHESESITDSIEKIIVGPMDNQDLAVRSLALLKQSRGLDFDVVKSKIPLRNL